MAVLNDDKKEKRASTRRGTAESKLLPPKLKLLVTVVDRKKAEFYLDYLQDFEVNMQLATAAEGTASTEMLRYLGLADNDKAVLVSVIQEKREEEILSFLSDKFRTVKNGKGIAFTVSMSSVIGVAIYRFLSNSEQ